MAIVWYSSVFWDIVRATKTERKTEHTNLHEKILNCILRRIKNNNNNKHNSNIELNIFFSEIYCTANGLHKRRVFVMVEEKMINKINSGK